MKFFFLEHDLCVKRDFLFLGVVISLETNFKG